LLLAGCGLVRLAGIRPDRNSYFPLAVGDQWDYRLVTTVERGDRLDTTTVATYEHRITGTAKLADGKPAFVRIWESQVTLHDSALPESTFSQSETTYLRRTGQAVYRYPSRASPPDSILLLPIQIDQQWESNGVGYHVMGRDDVQIEDQTYTSCWRIKTSTSADPNPINTWLAPGVGLVRLKDDRNVAGRQMHTDYYLTQADIR
jgi:hypothetical protein